MNLVPNAREILRKAWSVRLQALQVVVFGAAFGLQMIWPQLGDALPTSVFIGGAVIIGALTIMARLVKQKGISDED
jgi:Kef-type K+ transport system membrane component KefB